MNMGFLAIINAIEAEVNPEIVGDVVTWCDDNLDCAWSKAQDRFDKALAIAIQRQDYSLAKIEGEFYQATILDLCRKYKTAMKIKDGDEFLRSISKK